MNPVNTKPYQLPVDATWLITGCSSGIGREMATLMASNPNYRLIATARNPSSLSCLPDTENVLKLSLDVDSPASVSSTFAAAAVHFGSSFTLDVVNNAGYHLAGDTESVTEKEMHKQLETNFFGLVRVSLHALRAMREAAPRGGLIFNVSSVAGVCCFPGYSFYHASKWAVEGWTDKRQIAPHPAYADPFMPSRILDAFNEQNLAKGAGVDAADLAKLLFHIASRREQVPLSLPVSMTATALITATLRARLAAAEEVKELSAVDRNKAQFD
ncbi:NAD(P)-binding protein [Aspergillus tetrazonus]